jgi:PAS domain S-box-containing protein
MPGKPTYQELEARVAELERQRAQIKGREDRLRESEEKYRTLFQDSRDAIYITRRDGKFVDVNPALVELFGYTREEMIEKINVRQIYSNPDDRDKFQQEVEQKGSLRDYEVKFRKRNGAEIDCLLTSTLRRAGDGTILGYQGIIRDITERKRWEEALKTSSERIRRFAYSVSHDLKSPAVGIHGLTKRLDKHLAHFHDEKTRNYCEIIVRAAEQITALADQVNVFISTQETPLRFRKVKLAEILELVKEEVSPQLDLRRIRWLQPVSLPKIKVDRLSVLRVLRNLVDNALKHGGSELSEIKIGYQESDQYHILSVHDDGVAIRGEDSERIFGAFQRDETSRGVEGLGLGLAIVKEIAQQHGGEVWVESGPDKGKVFFVSFSRNL